MRIGHINLDRSINGIGEHFIKLIECLDRQGIHQHVIVANASLARRVSIYENVLVGPVTKTTVMSYCLMPDVDVVHVHDTKSYQAGLILRLTRSIPYVLTHRATAAPARNPIARSVITRSAGVICPTNDAANALISAGFTVPVDVVSDMTFAANAGDMNKNHIAAEHRRIYRRAVDTRRILALLL